MRGAAVVAHGGGPTPVLNASLAGVIAESRKHSAIIAVYGARFGAAGLLSDDLIDLSAFAADSLHAIRMAPGSVIGTSRRNLEDPDYARLLQNCQRRDVRFLFFTGGNGSMDTAMRIHRFARDAGYELRVIGIPKTIDNDLAGTDRTPGYASCARFFAHAARDIGTDNRALPPPIEILEVLGRNVGWVVAATALARHHDDDPPHLIYFPECGVSTDRMCADVERVYRKLGRCMIAVCEGQRDEKGGWFGAELNSRPGARDPLPGNMGHVIAKLLWSQTGLRARAEKPGLFGRSCAALASDVDRADSWTCGVEAVRAAIAGESGVMVALRPLGTTPATFLLPLDQVARNERPFPTEWLHPDRNDVAPAYLEWARPIVGEVAPHFRL